MLLVTWQLRVTRVNLRRRFVGFCFARASPWRRRQQRRCRALNACAVTIGTSAYASHSAHSCARRRDSFWTDATLDIRTTATNTCLLSHVLPLVTPLWCLLDYNFVASHLPSLSLTQPLSSLHLRLFSVFVRNEACCVFQVNIFLGIVCVAFLQRLLFEFIVFPPKFVFISLKKSWALEERGKCKQTSWHPPPWGRCFRAGRLFFQVIATDFWQRPDDVPFFCACFMFMC